MDTATASKRTLKWKAKMKKLIFSKTLCGVCLSEKLDLVHCDDIYHIEGENSSKEYTVREIIDETFGDSISNLLLSTLICNICFTNILKSHRLITEMKSNYKVLKNYVNILSEQVKQTIPDTKVEPQLMLTIDNVMSLNVPTTVTKADEEKNNKNVIQIFLCEVDNSDMCGRYGNVIGHKIAEQKSKYECPYCSKQMNDYEAFKTHYESHTETAFKCMKCYRKFSIFEKYIEHRKTCYNDSVSFCETCRIILHGEGIKEHENIHTEQIFICDECQMIFLTKTALARHVSESHKEISIQCPHCLKDFSDKFRLNHHRCLYKCLECKESCIHEEYLKNYREQHSANAEVFKCVHCDFRYLTRSQLISHVNNEHLLHFPYLCDHCGDCFASKPQLTVHMYKKHSDLEQILETFNKSLDCDQCRYHFNSEQAFTKHMKKHLTKPTQCQYCTKVFSNIDRLETHLKNRHSEEVANKGIIYQCTMCTDDFNSRAEYLKHVPLHPKEDKHICRICGVSFSSKMNYFSHVRKHAVKYDRECAICFKKYTKHTIARHMTAHLRESKTDYSSDCHKSVKRIPCDVCGIFVDGNKALLQHSEEHDEKKQCPHCEKLVNSVFYSKHVKSHKHIEDKVIKTCDYCPYTTKFSVCLEAHRNRFHLKVRPYQCALCDKTFYSEYTLKGHRLTHGKDRPELYCHVCGNKFISKKALTLHTRLHTGETPYPCELCEMSFLSASRRRQHMIRKHFEPSVVCELCQKKFYTQSDLKRHVGDCHHTDNRKEGRKLENVITVNATEEYVIS